MSHSATVGGERFAFADLRELMAKATPARSGDQLAELAASSARERVAARQALAGLNSASLQAALNALAPLKPGRPK